MMAIKDHAAYFQALQKEDLCLSYFSGPGCGVCGALKPKVEELLRRHPKVVSLQVDTAESPALAAQESIFSIPAVVLYVRGKESARWARSFGICEIEQRIERYEDLLKD